MNKTTVLNLMTAYMYRHKEVKTINHSDNGLSFYVMNSTAIVKIKHLNLWLFNILYVNHEIFDTTNLKYYNQTKYHTSWGASVNKNIMDTIHNIWVTTLNFSLSS